MRNFTRREKVLLVVLAVVLLIGVYILGVHYPVRSQLTQLESDLETAQTELSITQAKYRRYQSMCAELDDILSLPEDEITVMPEYDNLQNVMRQLDKILAPLGDRYIVSFSSLSGTDGVVRRPIQIDFVCGSYQEAVSILKRLNSTGYRCLLNDVTFDIQEKEEGGQVLTARVTVTYFERGTLG